METVRDVIKQRRSVRTYNEMALKEFDKARILKYAENNLTNPFSNDIKIIITDYEYDIPSTYGFIKGAKTYLAGKTVNSEEGLLAYGYVFEKIILYCQSIGVSTCWLGGSFKSNQFYNSIKPDKNEIIPAVTPLGYESPKKRLMDKIVKSATKSHSRKTWDHLFYDKNFDNRLMEENAGIHKEALEMVRLAPSGSNKQPWIVVADNDAVHFYKQKDYGSELDMGIAMCHYDLTVTEKGYKCIWKDLNIKEDRFSYIRSCFTELEK